MNAKTNRPRDKRDKRRDVITESERLPLGSDEATRDDRNEALPTPKPLKGYVMVSQDQLREVMKAIYKTEKPASTMRVWNAALSRVWYDTGEIKAGREQLADDAVTTPQEVSRAMTQLVKIGALHRIEKGRYAINPDAGWKGPLKKREAKLRLVRPDSD